MNNSNLINSMEMARKTFRDHIETLRLEAEDLITGYWVKWKERNQFEINQVRLIKTPKREYLGSYAPKVELIGNAKKVTITWHQFSPYKTRAPSHMSKRISPMKSGRFTKNCFVNHASWEYEMIAETEMQLEPYRQMLEFYHSSYIELGRKIRQYSKIEALK